MYCTRDAVAGFINLFDSSSKMWKIIAVLGVNVENKMIGYTYDHDVHSEW